MGTPLYSSFGKMRENLDSRLRGNDGDKDIWIPAFAGMT